MQALFYAHSGLRYLVLLAGLVALVYFAFALAGSRQPGRAARILSASFAGLLDLQIVLGLVLMGTGIYYGALIGHLTLMLLAAVAAHLAFAAARRATDPNRELRLRLIGTVTALVLIVGGILSIGRNVFGTGVLTGG